MRDSHPQRRPRSQGGVLIILLVAATAYSGLWLSERVAQARTESLSRALRITSAPSDREAQWRTAATRAPGGDPRRVLASAARVSRTDSYPANREGIPATATMPWAPLAAISAAP
ncbi:MAG: hypothetical protein C4521_12530 [Actinobacteria bacterium]|jgi:hypothetical protein|nr:MAG: hypothetical protein C4521_12530 [Actinomycetota bacterium]